MPTPINIDEFLDLVHKSKVVDEKRLSSYLDKMRASAALPAEPNQLAQIMVRDGLLTHFQAEQLLAGKWKRFTIGKYKVLERLGSGGMGSVYLCEHTLMRRRVAVKVLPSAKADDPSSLERFYREARAVAALDHPNIVRAYDIDQDEKLHFLVMEHVDGASLQEIIKRTGPMDVLRAAHYMRQSALGLQHAHETAGLVHRDIKPGNILVDRNGIVKVLDMGLARFFHDEDDILTKKYDENVLGTADYLAPEQALDSHAVDIRADIYSLGATFYYCLTGRTPFAEGTVAQKLIWHQTRQPKPIRGIRPEVPEELVAVIDKMMSKDPGQRYPTPQAVADALIAFTQTPIPPPPDNEMPQLSLAAMGAPGDTNVTGARAQGPEPAPTTRRPWQVTGPASSASAAGQGAAAVAPRQTAPGPHTPGLPSSPSRPVVTPAARALSSLPASSSNGPLRQATPSSPVLALPKQAVAVPTVVPIEEEPSWDKLTPETENPSALIDTGSHAGRASSVSNRVRKSGKKITLPVNHKTKLWLALSIASVVVLSALAVVIWLALRTPGTGGTQGSAGVGRAPLVVSPLGENGALTSLQTAIDRAVPGDRILLKGSILESVTLSRRKGLTIEADKDHNIAWGPPAKGFSRDVSLTRLLSIDNCEDCKIAGITFDGGPNGTGALIHVFGKCPGLVLDDLRLKNYSKYGAYLTNCEGSSEKPIQLSGRDLGPHAGNGAAVAVYFEILDSLPQKTNRFVTIRNVGSDGKELKVVNKKGTPHEGVVVHSPLKLE